MVLQLFLNPAFLKIAQVEIYTSAELCSNDNQSNEKQLIAIICANHWLANYEAECGNLIARSIKRSKLRLLSHPKNLMRTF